MEQFAALILLGVCNYASSTSNWRYYAGYQHTEHFTALQINSNGTVFVRNRHDILQFSNDERNTNINPEVTLVSICNESAKENDYKNTPVFMFQCYNNTIYLMTCCSYGPCFFHDISNISNFRMANTPPDQTVPLISSKGSALAVSGPCKSNYEKIYSAVSPLDDETTMTFSVLGLYFINDSVYLKYSNPDLQYITSNQNTNFEFIYGFPSSYNSHDFTYFLRNTKTTNGTKEAYISQTCNSDHYFESYIESKIECKGYATLEAATVLHLTGERSLLIGAFTGHGKNFGTKVCAYDVSTINLHFKKLLNNCFYHFSGSAPTWIKMNDNIAQTVCKSKSTKNLIDCGYTQDNSRILGNVTLVTEDLLMTVDEIITSVVLDLLGDIVVGYFGSSNGTIRKIIFEKELKNKMELFVWRNVHQEKIVDMKLNAERNRLYFIKGNTVGRIQIDNCTNHENCHACLEDIITCVWITDDSQNQGACVSNGSAQGEHIFETFCPPIITAISPINGPTKGGTRLTVNGIFVLAHSSSSKWIDQCCENGNLLQVMIGESPCAIVNVTDLPKRFVCETTANALKVEEDKIINVNVLGSKPNSIVYLQKVYAFGPVRKQYLFSYKIPMLNSDKATFPVKLSGGIQISLRGENLHIGSRVEVLIGDVPCPVTKNDKVTSSMITCQAPAMPRVATYETTIHIDNETLIGPNVTYLPDPVIEEFIPNSTIQSGGVTLIIYGENLSGLGETLKIAVTSSDHKNDLTISGSCDTGQSQIRCTLGKSIKNKLPVAGIVKLYNVYDDPLLTRDNSTLYVQIKEDPILFKNADEVIMLNNGFTVTFLGRNLLNVNRTEIKAAIGPYICIVTHVSDNNVTCKVPDIIYSIQKDVRHEAKVSIGTNIHYSLGFVIFASTEEKQTVSLGPILGITLPSILAFVLLVICIKWLLKCMRKAKNDSYNVRYRRDNNILALDELSESHTSEMGQNRLNDYQDHAHYRLVLENSSEKDTDAQLLQLNDETYAILKEKELLIDSECLIRGEIIGQGHFSCVYKGYLRLPNEKEEVIVAAKTLHRNNPKDLNVQMFLKEALIMKDFCHKNVMTLYGICFGIDQLPLVVLPFMKRGDLLSYIRDVNNVPTVKDLVLFSVDIANGMNYLADLKFVHRDLAARNCMIDDDMAVKVADFGLSRDVYEKEYYSSRDAKAKLPVKWMSPESLEFGMFNVKSDIWSFGIVLWELLTRGMNPYPTVDNWDMIRYLKDGRRLGKPDFCPEEMFRIMLQCWEWEPDKRPTFKELMIKIPDLLRRLQKQI